MALRTFASVAEIHEALGQQIGPTEWFTIDQDRIDSFADATNDHQWIHCDVERSAIGPYGTTIAHGYLTLSLLPALSAELYTIEAGSARINYGSNKVRYPQAVRAGDRIRLIATIKDFRSESENMFLTVSYLVEIDGGDKPALAAETVTLILS
ncbi:MaoC family dehydratase [Dietzia sp. NPDC055340]